jgi:hypothetical protein
VGNLLKGRTVTALTWRVSRTAPNVIGKIRLNLAASSAPVAVKRRAVEPVNKVKILPVVFLTQLNKMLN